MAINHLLVATYIQLIPLELRKSLKGGDKDDNKEKVFSNQKKTDKKVRFSFMEIL